MNSYIVSLKYAPGLAKEFCLLGKKLGQHGANVQYLLSDGYEWLLSDHEGKTTYVTTSQNSRQMIADTLRFPFSLMRKMRAWFKAERPDFLCVYNPHPLNAVVMRLAKQSNPQGKRAIYLHEPYKPDKGSFGRIGQYYFALVEFFQTLSIRYATTIIVPSPHAHELFLMRYPSFKGDVHIAPILIPDIEKPALARKYISLVGTINKSRGLDTFIALINAISERGLDWQFKIMTRNNVQQALEQVTPKGQALLTTVIKSEISDQEISDVVAESVAIFLPHKQVTQSGNVPVSFRVGTPIIARNLAGFSQHIRHQETGYLLPDSFTLEQLIEAIDYLQEHVDIMSTQARNSFEDTFSIQNWERYYDWILQSA